jgi:hypothetical protein
VWVCVLLYYISFWSHLQSPFIFCHKTYTTPEPNPFTCLSCFLQFELMTHKSIRTQNLVTTLPRASTDLLTPHLLQFQSSSLVCPEHDPFEPAIASDRAFPPRWLTSQRFILLTGA